MSVLRVKRRNRKTGKEGTIYMIDFIYRFPDGRRERIRRVAQSTSIREAQAEERRIRTAYENATVNA